MAKQSFLGPTTGLCAFGRRTGGHIRELPGHAGGVTGLAVTPRRPGALSAGRDAQLHLQEWQTGKDCACSRAEGKVVPQRQFTAPG